MECLQYLDIDCTTALDDMSFKPYYNWNAFNTPRIVIGDNELDVVLNLVISGLPSIHFVSGNFKVTGKDVLNLVISGMPSILTVGIHIQLETLKKSFKPYYNWNAFNTKMD